MNALSECAGSSIALGEAHYRVASTVAWMGLQAGTLASKGSVLGQ